MSEVIPAIYTRQFGPPRVTSLWRLVALGVSAGCLAVLITAAMLTPSASGVGTHLRLGLESCAWLDRSGLPCATCGMTTSFAWFVRGNLPASLYTQPMGTVLALATAIAFWVGLYIALTGKPILRLLRPIPPRYYVIPLIAIALLAWGWKMLLQVRGVDGWQ